MRVCGLSLRSVGAGRSALASAAAPPLPHPFSSLRGGTAAAAPAILCTPTASSSTRPRLWPSAPLRREHNTTITTIATITKGLPHRTRGNGNLTAYLKLDEGLLRRPARHKSTVATPTPSSSTGRWVYPATRRDESVVDERGVPDPYRWLEDPEAQETRAWVEQQNKLTQGLLEECAADRSRIQARLREVYDYPKYSCPFKRGERFYFFKNEGLQDHPILYAQESLDAAPTVFLDPNKLSEDGTASLGAYAFSESGAYLAHGIQRSGSDWQTMLKRNRQPFSEMAIRAVSGNPNSSGFGK